MKWSLVILALVVGQLCWAEETTTEKAKNETGPGRYHSNRRYGGHRHKDNDYGHKRYHAPIIDDYVCDLEATILVVSSKHHVKEEKSYGEKKSEGYGGQQSGGGYGNQGGGYEQPQSYGGNQGGDYNSGGGSYGNQQPQYGGQQPYRSKRNSGYGSSPSYGGNGYEDKPKRHEYATPEALRLKCSHIAIHSEHDCKTCCQLSARRYHSVSRHDIFGFIVDAGEIKYDDKGYVRSKRNAGYGSQPAAPTSYGSAPAPSYNAAPAPYESAPSYGSAPAPSYESPPAYGNGQDYSAPETPSYSAPETPAYSASESSSYSAATNDYHHGPPKNARCVCCAPKRDGHHRRHHDNYDRSDSDEY